MSLLTRITRVFNSSQLDRELEEELRAHLEMRTADNAEAGMPAEEARRDALQRFGNPVLLQEQTRGTRIFVWLETVLQDIRFGFRSMRKSPGFTIVALLTVALTIGATAAVFTVVNSVLLRPLPYPDADRLVSINSFLPRLNGEAITSAEYLRWRARSRSFELFAAYDAGGYNVSGVGIADHLTVFKITASMFQLLGLRPALGRFFADEEGQPGSEQVIVISHRRWQENFGSSPEILGKVLRIDGVPHTIIGVLPRRFPFPNVEFQPDFLCPIVLPSFEATRSLTVVQVIGRVHRGTRFDDALKELQSISQQLWTEYPPAFQGMFKDGQLRVKGLQAELVGDVRHSLLMLMSAVGLVLLIGCLNIASLQLARSVQRSGEVRMRAALGARRARLVRQLITENVLLASCGALGGAALALITARLVRTANLKILPPISEVRIDTWVVVFTALVAVLSGVLFGLAPALSTWRSAPLSGGPTPRSTLGKDHRRLSKSLLIIELGAALVLLTGAGLLVRSFQHLLSVDPGFNYKNVVTASVSPNETEYPSLQNKLWYLDMISQKLQASPHITSWAVASNFPFVGYDINLAVVIQGKPAPAPGMAPMVPLLQVGPGYFDTLKIPLLRGRDFTFQDNQSSPRVAVVSQAFARKFLPGENTLGKRFQVSKDNKWATIVGVVGDIRHVGLDKDPPPEIYVPFQQAESNQVLRFGIVLRTSDPVTAIKELKRAVHDVDPNQPVFDILSLEQKVSDSLSTRRLSMWLLGAFAGLALLLALVGIYGVLSYWVGQRSQEIGIRLALGADRARITKSVLGQAGSLAAAGILLGASAALGLTRLISSLLYGTKTYDPLTFISVAALMLAVGLAAGYFPARRASKVDPMVALRSE